MQTRRPRPALTVPHQVEPHFSAHVCHLGLCWAPSYTWLCDYLMVLNTDCVYVTNEPFCDGLAENRFPGMNTPQAPVDYSLPSSLSLYWFQCHSGYSALHVKMRFWFCHQTKKNTLGNRKSLVFLVLLPPPSGPTQPTTAGLPKSLQTVSNPSSSAALQTPAYFRQRLQILKQRWGQDNTTQIDVVGNPSLKQPGSTGLWMPWDCNFFCSVLYNLTDRTWEFRWMKMRCGFIWCVIWTKFPVPLRAQLCNNNWDGWRF